MTVTILTNPPEVLTQLKSGTTVLKDVSTLLFSYLQTARASSHSRQYSSGHVSLGPQRWTCWDGVHCVCVHTCVHMHVWVHACTHLHVCLKTEHELVTVLTVVRVISGWRWAVCMVRNRNWAEQSSWTQKVQAWPRVETMYTVFWSCLWSPGQGAPPNLMREH